MIQQISTNVLTYIIPMNSFTLESIFTQSTFAEIYKERYEENSVYLIPQYLIDYLSNIYIFENPEEIKKYLSSNKDLIEILITAPEHILSIFGNVPIYLELHHDPEEEWDELFIIIKSNYSPKKAIELKNKLFDEWFIYIIDKIATRLNFTEEPL